MQEPVCASKKQLDCVESLKIDTSNCLKPCSGLLVTSFSKSDVHVHSKSLNLLPINKKYRVSQKKVGSQKISNCSNSLNFEAKINCNTIKPNVPKWRKTCTGLKFDLLNFYGTQSNIHTF